VLCATVTIMAARRRLWDILPSWLQTILNYRLARFALAAIPLSGLGLGVYYIEVSRFDANMYYVRPVNWVALTFIGFVVNWLIFAERQVPKGRSGLKFYLAAGLCSVASNGLFVWLHTNFGLYYLLAQMVAGLIVGLPHYFALSWGVFTRMRIKPV
jgi:hypothetical protein